MQSTKFFAVRFNTEGAGESERIISYSLLGYNHFLNDIKNKGYKVHLTSFKTATDAEHEAMRQVGLTLLEFQKKSAPLDETAVVAAEEEESGDSSPDSAAQ